MGRPRPPLVFLHYLDTDEGELWLDVVGTHTCGFSGPRRRCLFYIYKEKGTLIIDKEWCIHGKGKIVVGDKKLLLYN